MPRYRRPWTVDILRSRCTEEGECLLWNGAVNSAGHPTASIEGKAVLVRRFAYVNLYGKTIHPGRCLVSSCGNKTCCSEPHLLSKTQREMVTGVYADWKRNDPRYLHTMQRRCVTIAKLDLATAEAIRASGKHYTEVAKEHGISNESARRIVRGLAWQSPPVSNSVFTFRP